MKKKKAVVWLEDDQRDMAIVGSQLRERNNLSLFCSTPEDLIKILGSSHPPGQPW